MEGFIAQHWLEVIFALITAGALALCKYAFSQMKNYKKLLEEQDQSEIVKLIREELKPIAEQFEKLTERVAAMDQAHQFQLNAIVESYKFRLIRLCKQYLDQGYMTTEQFDQLSEFHKLYNKLGGNNQGDEYYEKAKRLPVKDEE